MKNLKVISFVATLAIVITIIYMSSCSKQELADKPFAEEREVIMNEEDISIMNRIVTFREKVNFLRDNPDYKSNDILGIDSAIWLMEALFNYSYSFPDELYNSSKSDTGTFIFYLDNNGYVDINEVSLRFIEQINKVSEFYHNSGFEDKGLIITNLELQSINGNEAKVSIYAVTGKKGNIWDPFVEGDDWWFGSDDGKCDGNPFSDTIDAAELIEIAINNNKPLIYPPPGYRFFYIPDDPITLDGNEYLNPESPDPLDNFTDYLTFYCSTSVGEITEIEECLEYDEMNFHFHGEETIIYDKLPEQLGKPSNWVFINCNLYDISDLDDVGNFRIRHESVLNFGYQYLLPNVDPQIEL